MATSAIFYFSQRNPKDHRDLHEMWQDGLMVGYIRIELVNCKAEEALNRATPKRGESLMNTHELINR